MNRINKSFAVFISLFAYGTVSAQLEGPGRAVGSFGRGAAESISEVQPSWVTIQPRSRDDCIEESGGEINNVYVRCRNGRQEYTRVDSRGRRFVLRERPIPTNFPPY